MSLAKNIYEKIEKRLGANTGRIITVILFGILLLIVVIPADGCSETSTDTELSSDDSESTGLFFSASSYVDTDDISDDISDVTQSVSDESEYYELRLKNILETSYGEGSVQVMVYMTKASEKSLYGDVSEGSVIDGVLVVADVETANELLTISEAVCALFDLPACKVYVIKKS